MRGYGCGRRNGCGADAGLGGGIIMLIILFFFAMPFYGGYLLITGKSSGTKVLGGIIFAIGVALWINFGMFS